MVNQDFDHIAQLYDKDFSYTLIGKAQRELVWNVINQSNIKLNGLNVLEINCGTGLDAKLFAQGGSTILATDISSEMIKQTALKLAEFKNANFRTLDIKQLYTLEGHFDLIFSNFGGLNCLCTEEINQFMINSANLLNKNGKLVLVVMPKLTLKEIVYFLAKFSPKRAFRRMKKNGVLANVEGKLVRTYYYNPNDLLHSELYSLESCSPIGLSVPPSYLENRYKSRPELIKRWFEKDIKRFNNIRLSKLADHFCIVLQKK